MFEEVTAEEERRGGLDPLEPSAAAELAEQTVGWRERVLAEAARLAAGRDGGNQREPITPHDIKRAVHNVDGLPAVHRQSGLVVALQVTLRVVSYVAAALAGYFVNNIDEPRGSIGFAITAILGALAIILDTLAGWYGDQIGRKGRR